MSAKSKPIKRPTESSNNMNTSKQQPNKKRSNGKSAQSRGLSWALRHAAPSLGLKMRPDGYVKVQDILDHACKRFRGLSLASIQEIVKEDTKQRFSLIEDSNNIYWIRANQGHSIDGLDPEKLLRPLSLEQILELNCMVHGTYLNAWKLIEASGGLSKMNRTHIHFAKGMPQDDGVISGMRQSCDVFVYVNLKKVAESSSIQVMESANGVLLTDGINGILPMEYLSHVVTKKGEILFDQR